MSWANTVDRSARTAKAREALQQRFLDEAGGDPVKADHLRQAFYARLALKSAQARRRAREAITQAEAVETEIQELARLAGVEVDPRIAGLTEAAEAELQQQCWERSAS